MKKIFLLALIINFKMASASDVVIGYSTTISEPVTGDLYITGGRVLVSAPVHGDLVVVGGTVEINDTIYNDLLILGGSVLVRGIICDDLRSLAGNLTIDKNVIGDIVASGGKVIVNSNAIIGSLTVAGSSVLMNGVVNGNAKSLSGNFILNGTIKGDADLRGENIQINGLIGNKAVLAGSKEIIIGKAARIAGSTHYWLPLDHPLRYPTGVSSFTPIYDPLLSVTHSRWYLLGASTFVGLLWYLGTVFLIVVMLNALIPKTFFQAGKTLATKPVKSFWAGILTSLLVPLTVLLLLVTVIGVPLALFLILFSVAIILMSTTVSALVVTYWIAGATAKSWTYGHYVAASMFTFCLLRVLSLTPFFGQILSAMIVLTSLGAIILGVKKPSLKMPRNIETDDRGQPTLTIKQPILI